MSTTIRKSMHITELQQRDYRAGKTARKQGASISACPFVEDEKTCCWKAGWHDADIEAGNRITNFHPITKQEIAA
jgi:ribosome modulation factor